MAHRLSLLAAGVALALTAAPAYAATGSPPVTHPDIVRLHADEAMAFDLTENDTDPDGDKLAVCRVGDDVPRKLRVLVEEGQLLVLPRARAMGTYTFTYYACDSSYLTPGQVTVKVEAPAPTLDVSSSASCPAGSESSTSSRTAPSPASGTSATTREWTDGRRSGRAARW